MLKPVSQLYRDDIYSMDELELLEYAWHEDMLDDGLIEVIRIELLQRAEDLRSEMAFMTEDR